VSKAKCLSRLASRVCLGYGSVSGHVLRCGICAACSLQFVSFRIRIPTLRLILASQKNLRLAFLFRPRYLRAASIQIKIFQQACRVCTLPQRYIIYVYTYRSEKVGRGGPGSLAQAPVVKRRLGNWNVRFSTFFVPDFPALSTLSSLEWWVYLSRGYLLTYLPIQKSR